jgi:outer membrane protein assembly factor BamE (lipoprotein component of BamABCDE complex)
MKTFWSRKLALVLAAALITVALAACGEKSRINAENFEKVRTGMSQTEVRAILGEPTESSSVDVAVFAGANSIWKWQDTTIAVQFVNGKVIAKQMTKEPAGPR